MQVAWLGEPASLDASSVGGKTANLGRLAGSFRVPPGFCIDASVFDELRPALDDAGARARLHQILSTSYAELAERVGETSPHVAVRSSAIGEDAADASFAGQHETVLNVVGADAITEAVLECWRSVASERAAAYRRERGITAAPRIAVLVQQMVDAETSAIAFSADPVTGSREVVVINAAPGLGDTIASGAITPDSFSIRKTDLAIIDRRSVNGTAIADSDVLAIARLTAQLESVMGGPVDVECALRSGELHLLQCRPITTLAEEFVVKWVDPEDAKLTWRRDDAHQTGVIPPLAIEYTRNGASYGMRKRDEKLGPPVLTRHEAFNGRIYNSAKPLRPPEEMVTYAREALARRRRLARHIRRDWDERYLPELDEHYAWMRALEPERMSASEAVDAWDELWRRHRRAWVIHMLVTGSAYPVMDELTSTYEELVGGPAADALALTQGLADTLQRLDQDLYELTMLARQSPAAGALARGVPLEELRAADAALGAAIDTFLAAHGDAGQSAEGLGRPAWSDDPSLLIGTIAARMARPPTDPRTRLAALRARADEVARKARARLADRPADLARFEEVLAAAVSAGPLTEEHNYWLDRRNQAGMSRAARRFGRRLVRDGALRNFEDILLLYVGEIRRALADPRDLSPLIAERQAEQRRWKRMRSPEILGAPPTGQPNLATSAIGHLLFKATQSDPTRELRGAGASAGVARGPARLIRELGEFSRFRSGDVLVCQSSNVSWIPLFTSAVAVVTEVGGPLSHAAVVAREFGVPAVVGTAIALSTLKDGELVEVDGTAGVVRRLGAPPDPFPVTWDDPDDARLTWKREDGHLQHAMAPLAIDYVMLGIDHGIRTRAKEFGPPVLTRHRAFNGWFYVSVKPLLPPDALPAELTAAMQRRRVLARRIAADWESQYMPELLEHYRWMRDLAVRALPRADLADAWADLWRRVGRIWLIHFIVVSPAYTVMEELAQAYEQLVGGAGADVFAVTQGLAPSLHRFERDLESLEDKIRGSAVASAIVAGERSVERLRGLDGGVAFAAALEGFLARQGDIGQEGFDLDSRAFRDDPEPLLALVAQRLVTSPERWDARHARVRARADQTMARARATLAQRPADLERFEEIAAAAMSAGPLTEEHNYWIDRVAQAHVARLVRAVGGRLVREGVLGAADEIFLLCAAEVESALRAPSDLRALLAERAADLARWRGLTAPEFVGAPPSTPVLATPGVNLARVDLAHVVVQDDPSVIKGVPACAGLVRGRARIIDDPGDFAKLRAGDVLVCRSSNASWVPLFTLATAVVTEIGGALSHAAVVAREFGVPAVVGTGVARSALRDGDLVEVDGAAGTVRRIAG